MYLPSACFENGFENPNLYRYTQECQNYRELLLNNNIQKCCEDSCSEYNDLITLSNTCMLCSFHFKELSKKIDVYEYDKSVIICRNHRTPYDHNILKDHFPNFSPNKKLILDQHETTKIKSRATNQLVTINCILDNSHEAKLVKNKKKNIIIKCDQCMKKICCLCGIMIEKDSHECGEDGEDLKECLEMNGFVRCEICGLFSLPQGDFVNCYRCSNEVCVTCKVPKYLVNAHGLCMHRCDLNNNSSSDKEYDQNCLSCNMNGGSCFNSYYGTDRQFEYQNNN
jgi:hypothetical protein